ncbi:MAG: tRNA (N6-threonylcarbamoyladenosine(37)-N6)-methyltransferase TrmO [Bacteroidales bacterium]|nr:tRNA (N6-threonylcarbamoyladenosine(37)-N6)-methyltransferase TrmO [Bacteroidales bacterium]
MRPIAHIKSPFPEKFGIPRQSNIVQDLTSTIVFEPEFRNADAIRGIEDFDYLWLIWQFSENLDIPWSPTVRPPRLGGNQRMGVFATRSPFRPNALGLSSVRLVSVEPQSCDGPLLHVSGADLMDGTPIFDIKPYLPYTDAHPEARSGFAPEAPKGSLDVVCDEYLLKKIPEEKRQSLLDLLAFDPRPSYHHDPQRVYGMKFFEFNIQFIINENGELRVLKIVKN